MGYDIELVEARFRITAGRAPAALSAVLALFSPDDITLASGGVTTCGANAQTQERWFAFLNPELIERAIARRDLAYALDAFRFVPTRTAEGDIVALRFRGERSGDERFLFEALGPYVDPGSYVEMAAEDGARWRWSFDGSTCQLHVIVPSQWGPLWLTGHADTGAAPGWAAT
ncbi:MAG TPA: hypothetical protein VFR37_05375 [Longimicrobium sp.]|nr:hypothetical protein [Longimicrobium sp.]